MGEKRTIDFEELGRPESAGRFPVRGIGFVVLSRQDIEEWRERDFHGRMMIIRTFVSPGTDHEWQFVGWAHEHAAA